MRHLEFPLALLLLATSVGCSTTATIVRNSGSPVEAHIAGADGKNVYVETDDDVQTIPLSDVKDIDHPGDGAMLAGGILMGYGAINIAVGAPQCDAKGAAFCVGVFTPLAVGIPIAIWGAVVHANSTSALEHLPAWKTGRLLVLPLVPTGNGAPGGAGVVGTF